jgi:hypothetical protein
MNTRGVFHMQLPVAYILAALVIPFLQGCTSSSTTGASPLPPIPARELTKTYNEIRRNIMSAPSVEIPVLVDETARELFQLSGVSMKEVTIGYVRHVVSSWPDTDSLEIADFRSNGRIARITLKGNGRSYRREPERVCYTFLLFQKLPESWNFVGIYRLEQNERDRYGHTMSVHETDLPHNFRFPRLF